MTCVDIVNVMNAGGDVRFLYNGDPYERIRSDIEDIQQHSPIRYCPYDRPYSVNNVCQYC